MWKSAVRQKTNRSIQQTKGNIVHQLHIIFTCLYKCIKSGLWYCRLSLHTTNSYGYPTENGSYEGLVGLLQRNEVQLGVSAIRIWPSRLDVVDFTAPTWLLRYELCTAYKQDIYSERYMCPGTSYRL
jgi:hypothetical protein